MEKVVAVLLAADRDEDWCERQRGPVAEALLGLGVAGLTVNVRDAAVSKSLMTLTTLDPPAAAVVSIWTPAVLRGADRPRAATAGGRVRSRRGLSGHRIDSAAGATRTRQRTTGLANIALLRQPAGLDHASWLQRWQHDHTPVAIETQSTFGYTQNAVVRALTPDAPQLAGIVEELFPIEAITDLKAFFGAADDADLQQRLSRMVASTSAFGANENIDTVPTSRYVLKTPFNS